MFKSPQIGPYHLVVKVLYAEKYENDYVYISWTVFLLIQTYSRPPQLKFPLGIFRLLVTKNTESWNAIKVYAKDI